MASEVPPATTEISLKSDASITSYYKNFIKMNGSNASNIGGKSYFNASSTSSSVGSRLAGGDDSDIVIPQQQQEKQQPQPAAFNNTATMKSTMGWQGTERARFGNTAPSKAQVASKITLQDVQQVAAVKAESFKLWSVKAYKCTKQLLSEKMGRGTRTVDLELEARIEVLRDTKQKYENIVALMKAFCDHFTMMCQTQKVLGEAFGELAGKSQDLQEEFQFNGETQFVLSKNGESLMAAINFFISSMNTLCSKTMDDTLTTVKRYESARVEYDAYRAELEGLKLAPRTESNLNKQQVAQANFTKHKDIYERLRSDVAVKLQFLDENRVKVMQKQLLLFHNAISAYFAGNQQQLQATLNQFNIKLDSPNNQAPSWLEKNGADH